MRNFLPALALLAFAGAASANDYDLAINNGRVIDPETGLDAVRSIGVSGGVIERISKKPLPGAVVIDAAGQVVAPGFIDRNAYTLGPGLFRVRAADGVTTVFNFEEGAHDVPAAYAAHEGKALINYGFSASWGAARTAAGTRAPIELKDGVSVTYPPEELVNRSMTEEELVAMLAAIEAGIKAGAPAVGVGVEYAPGATNSEILGVLELAAKYGRAVQIHMREWNETTDHQDIYEVIAAAAVTGGAIHASHLNSSGDEYTLRYLDFLDRARDRGLQVTTECYPYAAWMTDIRAAFMDNWRDWDDERFARLEWPETGERLTRETFAAYREKGGLVIGHVETREWVDACVAHPQTQIASDGGWDEGKTHPRVGGTNTRILGRYVREKKLLSLNDAIAKMTILPAQSLEEAAPQMAKKARLQKGMDADIVVFDSETVMDRATYQEPVLPPEGIKAVVVNGVVVLLDGAFADGVFPGEAIRAPVVRLD